MKKNNKKYYLKIKEFINKFQEAWKEPRKKAGIKLLSYLIFFLLFLIIASIGTNIKTEQKPITTTTTTTKKKETFYEKQKIFLENNHSINYEIKINDTTYKINGTLKDNIIEGYLEELSGIKKIIIKDNNIYEIKNNTESILQTNLNMNKLNINYILDILKNNSAYINNAGDTTTYQYIINMEDIENTMTVYTNEKTIYKITIVDGYSEYVFNFDNLLSE